MCPKRNYWRRFLDWLAFALQHSRANDAREEMQGIRDTADAPTGASSSAGFAREPSVPPRAGMQPSKEHDETPMHGDHEEHRTPMVGVTAAVFEVECGFGGGDEEGSEDEVCGILV